MTPQTIIAHKPHFYRRRRLLLGFTCLHQSCFSFQIFGLFALHICPEKSKTLCGCITSRRSLMVSDPPAILINSRGSVSLVMRSCQSVRNVSLPNYLSVCLITKRIYSDLTKYLSLMPWLVLTLSLCSDISVSAPEFRKIPSVSNSWATGMAKIQRDSRCKRIWGHTRYIKVEFAMFLQRKTTNQVKLTGLQMYFHCDGTTFCQN